MRTISHFTLATVALAGLTCTSILSATQTGAPGSQMPSAGQAPKFQFSSGALLRVELDKTVDAKKAKVGDAVAVKLTDDIKRNAEVLVPKGTNILGRITQVAQHQGQSPSVLGIAFDKLPLSNDSAITFNAIIQAVGFPDESTSDQAVAGGIPGSRGPAPGQVGGSGGTMGQPSAYPGSRMPSASSDTPSLKLSPNAKGVVGISGASLSTGAAGDSVISSEKHNVKLERGVQMILRVQ